MHFDHSMNDRNFSTLNTKYKQYHLHELVLHDNLLTEEDHHDDKEVPYFH